MKLVGLFILVLAFFLNGCSNRPASIFLVTPPTPAPGLVPPQAISCSDGNYTVSAYGDAQNAVLPGQTIPYATIQSTVTQQSVPISFEVLGYTFNNADLEEVQAPGAALGILAARFRPKKFGVFPITFTVKKIDADLQTQCTVNIELEKVDPPPAPDVIFTIHNSTDDITVPHSTRVSLSYNASLADSCTVDLIVNGSTTRLPYTDPSDSFFHTMNNNGAAARVRTYTVTCSGLAASTSKTISVTINPRPTATLQVRKGNGAWGAEVLVDNGENYQLSWSSEFASQCNILANSQATAFNQLQGNEVLGNLAATTTYVLSCSDGVNPAITESVLVRKKRPDPVISFTANGQSDSYSKPWNQAVTVSWSATHADNCNSSDSEITNAVSGSFNISTNGLPQQRTFSITCTGDESSTKTLHIENAERYYFFYYTHLSDTDVTVNQVVGTNHPFANFNFKNQSFKVHIHTRLLSFINWTKPYYTEADITYVEDRPNFAEITSINRYAVADRPPTQSQCTPVPDSVFGTYRMDQSTMNGGSLLDLSQQSGTVYLMDYGVRDRFGTSSQGSCAPSIHSSRTNRWGAVVAQPNFNACAYPWSDSDRPSPCGGYWVNSYGNGAYVYVDGGGAMHLQYRTTRARTTSFGGVNARVVFLIGLYAPAY